MKYHEMMYFSRNFVYAHQSAGGAASQSHCHHPPESGVQSKISAAKTGDYPQQKTVYQPCQKPPDEPAAFDAFRPVKTGNACG